MTANRMIAVALALVLVVPPFVQPVAAKQPSISRFEVSQSFDDQSCGFQITVDFTVKVTEKVFLDPSGAPNRVQLLVRRVSTLTNPDNGKFLIGHAAEVFHFPNSDSEPFTVVGLFFQAKTPQGGVVAFDAGKIVLDANLNVVFQAGHFSSEGGIIPPFPPAVCAELM